MGGDSCVGERQKMGRTVFIGIVGIVRVTIVELLGGFDRGVREHKCELGGCTLAADARSPLEGGSR